MNMPGYVFITVGMLLLMAVSFGMVRSIQGGNFQRNDMVGIRTKSTLASDDAWHKGHTATIPALNTTALIGAGGILCTVVILFLNAPIGPDSPGPAFAFPAGAFTLQILALIWAAVKANRAAQSTET